MRSVDRSNRLALVILGVSLGFGCDTVDGGAVELSWKLRPASSASEDKFVDCTSDEPGTGEVTSIRLSWPEGDAVELEEWPCSDSHGVTGFVLPPGPTLFTITPICASGPADPASYIAPAVERRDVKTGDTVSLGAVELVVQVSSCDRQPCICH